MKQTDNRCPLFAIELNNRTSDLKSLADSVLSCISRSWSCNNRFLLGLAKNQGSCETKTDFGQHYDVVFPKWINAYYRSGAET